MWPFENASNELDSVPRFSGLLATRFAVAGLVELYACVESVPPDFAARAWPVGLGFMWFAVGLFGKASTSRGDTLLAEAQQFIELRNVA